MHEDAAIIAPIEAEQVNHTGRYCSNRFFMTKNSPTWSMPAFPAVVLSDARSHLRYRQLSAISVRQDIVKYGCLQLGQSSSRRFFVWKNLQWKRSQSEDRRVGLSGWRRGEKRSVSAWSIRYDPRARLDYCGSGNVTSTPPMTSFSLKFLFGLSVCALWQPTHPCEMARSAKTA